MKRMYQVVLGITFAVIVACSSNSAVHLQATAIHDMPIVSPTVTTTSVTPSAIPTSTSFSTNSGAPTVTVLSQELENEWYELLKNNGECKLPCLLGITPGKASWQESRVLFEEFGSTDFPEPNQDGSLPIFKDYHVRIHTRDEVILRTHIKSTISSNGSINDMVLGVEVFNTKNETETKDHHLDWYSIENIFKTFGQPDGVYLWVGRNLNYSIDIVYEAKKFILTYTGLANSTSDGNIKICPKIGEGDISVLGVAVGNPWNSADVKTLIPSDWNGLPPFEILTGIPQDEFYNLMINNSSQPTCIEFQAK